MATSTTPSLKYCGISPFLRYITSKGKLREEALSCSLPLSIEMPASFNIFSESSFNLPDF